MWRDRLPTGDEDFAVSFQNTDDCHSVWDSIGEVQSQYIQQSQYGLQPSFNLDKAPLIAPTGNGYFPPQAPSSSSHRLPIVSRLTLPDIKMFLLNASPFDKDSNISRLCNKDYEYLRQLLELFNHMEGSGDIQGLNVMAEIWRAALMLNEMTLIHFTLEVRRVLMDEYFFMVTLCLLMLCSTALIESLQMLII